jgi:hypothetical protein
MHRVLQVVVQCIRTRDYFLSGIQQRRRIKDCPKKKKRQKIEMMANNRKWILNSELSKNSSYQCHTADIGENIGVY